MSTCPLPIALALTVLLRGTTESREIDAEALDRLDVLISELKKQGIYVNLNLLASRRFKPGDGLGDEIRGAQGKMQHLLGFWYEPAFTLHAEYARKLIGHRNPYSGLT